MPVVYGGPSAQRGAAGRRTRTGVHARVVARGGGGSAEHLGAARARTTNAVAPYLEPAELERLRAAKLVQDQPDGRNDLEVESSGLHPRCLERGVWPDDEAWGLSDHGVVTTTFVRRGESIDDY